MKASLLISLLAVTAATPRIHVDLVLRGATFADRARAVASAEVTSIWARYGVDVRLVGSGDEPRDNAITIPVVTADRHHARQRPETLGSIWLPDGPGSAVITIYEDAVGPLLRQSTVPEWAFDQASPVRDVIVGRVLGRALAHELGHYLLRLPHARDGLMRATHLAADFVSPDERGFALTAEEIVRLESVLGGARFSSR